MKKLVGLAAQKLLVMLILFSNAYAKDFGTHGELFKINEEDMLEVIQTKLKHLEDTGRLAKYQSLLEKKAKEYVEAPKPLEELTETQITKSWDFDPSYITKVDIMDSKGSLLFKKGTVVNPLERVDMPYDLIFIDGSCLSQTNYALNVSKTSKKETRIILVKGSPMELMRRYKTRFYFDQKGILTSKFTIKHVPALVQQNGNLLGITEVKLNVH